MKSQFWMAATLNGFSPACLAASFRRLVLGWKVTSSTTAHKLAQVVSPVCLATCFHKLVAGIVEKSQSMQPRNFNCVGEWACWYLVSWHTLITMCLLIQCNKHVLVYIFTMTDQFGAQCTQLLLKRCNVHLHKDTFMHQTWQTFITVSLKREHLLFQCLKSNLVHRLWYLFNNLQCASLCAFTDWCLDDWKVPIYSTLSNVEEQATWYW